MIEPASRKSYLVNANSWQCNAEDDPILAAGVMRCPECGRVAFPTDAGRLEGGLILAAYPSPCGHVRGLVAVIGPGAVPAAGGGTGAADGWSRYVTGRRCAGRNRKGRPCRSFAVAGSDLCHAHQPVPAGEQAL